MNKVTSYLLIFYVSLLVLYSCADEGPTLPNNNTNTNAAPNKPSNPNPPDSAVNVNRIVNLSWTCTDPNAEDTLRFDVYIATVNPPDVLIAQNIPNPAYGLGLVDSNTTFYWKVVAKDNRGASATSNTWRFRTQ